MRQASRIHVGRLASTRFNLVVIGLAIGIVFISEIPLNGQAPTTKNISESVATSSAQTVGEQEAVIEGLSRLLRQNYVFPDIAEKIIEHIEKRKTSGAYLKTSGKQFADLLTNDLRAINNDKHLQVWVTPEKTAKDETNLGKEFSRSVGKHSNYGFEEVKILPGNVGYIKMSSFTLDQLYGESLATASAAMSFVSNSDALIFDLRGNGGGSPRLGRYLSSYLFSSTPVHLNDFYFRTSDSTQEYWTLENIDGKRMPNVKVFILISSGTFSAAEGFAYNLKHLGRATVVGESSGGGAHGGSTHSLADNFQTYIPFSRSIHPVTKTDYEGVGVTPDVQVSSKDALITSHMMAIKSLMTSERNEQNSELYAKTLASLKAQQTPVQLSQAQLEKYVGTYEIGPKQQLVITSKHGALFGQMTGDKQAVSASAITQTRFRVDDYNKVEFTFELDADGNVTGLTLHKGTGLRARKVD